MLQEGRVYRVPDGETDELRVRAAAWCAWAEFQQNVVYGAIDQWRKRPKACIHAEGGRFEQLL